MKFIRNEVSLINRKEDNKVFAMKKIKNPIYLDSKEKAKSWKQVIQGAEIIKIVKHPLIIEYIDHYNEMQTEQKDEFLCIVMEYAKGKIFYILTKR